MVTAIDRRMKQVACLYRKPYESDTLRNWYKSYESDINCCREVVSYAAVADGPLKVVQLKTKLSVFGLLCCWHGNGN